MTNVQKRVLFIGAGRMAQAIIEGLVNKTEFAITVANKGNQERLEFVKNHYGVETTEHWVNHASEMDIIFLAMPPDAHASILKELAEKIGGQLVMTVAAGISPTYMESMLPDATPVVSVMPNTAAKQGESITLYAPGQHVNQQHIQWIETLLSGIGEYEKVTEKQIEELTAITGSAPAFIYKLAGVLEQMALETGVTQQQARKLVAQMIAGSAEMLKTNIDTTELINQVATPGGSTAAGLDSLDNNQFNTSIQQAIIACRKKAAAIK
ncbi:pyrroline-5-carboxylate reductase [Neobacillus dielmonensis]|uniref:pyrroline-5-carboxylate reductase n=1 Tax=Neobacillus dielmonensis TaxID=1347369 RepID=UPI0005A8FE09|nr:pyrroline-5-carboxylate reductase [Neobacillus dielmonensis]